MQPARARSNETLSNRLISRRELYFWFKGDGARRVSRSLIATRFDAGGERWCFVCEPPRETLIRTSIHTSYVMPIIPMPTRYLRVNNASLRCVYARIILCQHISRLRTVTAMTMTTSDSAKRDPFAALLSQIESRSERIRTANVSVPMPRRACTTNGLAVRLYIWRQNKIIIFVHAIHMYPRIPGATLYQAYRSRADLSRS